MNYNQQMMHQQNNNKKELTETQLHYSEFNTAISTAIERKYKLFVLFMLCGYIMLNELRTKIVVH